MELDDFNKEVWHDTSLDKIVIEYNDIIVNLETDTGTKKVIFKNYIAFDYIGQWDENIVKAIYEVKDNEFVNHALQKINLCNDVNYKGGGTRDIATDWKCIIIELVDGICIRIVCSDVILVSE